MRRRERLWELREEEFEFAKLMMDIMIPPEISEALRGQGCDVLEARALPLIGSPPINFYQSLGRTARGWHILQSQGSAALSNHAFATTE
jgi:hypothetical protein